ncbi:MAG TPA: hypothetical protein VFQ37_01905 [Mycobacterium sp.]|nr:hypothetical protein [Mycobacterium sp.]
MFWLLVAATPTLLMLAAIGLERIETGLNHVGAAAAEVRALLEHVEAEVGYAASHANPQFRTTQPAHRV